MKERLALLEMMGAAVAGDASHEAAATCFGRLGVLSSVQKHRGEGELLARFPDVLVLLEALPPREQMLVRNVLSTIVEDRRGTWNILWSIPPSFVRNNWNITPTWWPDAWASLECRAGPPCPWRCVQHPAGRGAFAVGSPLRDGSQLVNILRDREEDFSRGEAIRPETMRKRGWKRRSCG